MEPSKEQQIRAMPPGDVDHYLRDLKLIFIAQHYGELATQAAGKQWSQVEYLARLLEGEAHLRRDRATHNRLRQARFPVIKTLDQFRWDWPTQINRLQVQHHFGLGFLKDRTNLIYLGGVGLGKPPPGHCPYLGHSVASEQTITVLDPRHPLCGRTFTLIAMTSHAQLGRCCVVRLRPHVERWIPVQATNLAFDPTTISPTPLSLSAVEQLLRVIHDIHHATQGVSSDASSSPPRGAAAPARQPDCAPSAVATPVRRPATARPKDSARRRATVGGLPAKPITM